ncbi:MAG TPA: flagellar basal body protein FliL [Bacteroidetes bacterium]|nr:flagellar basal body protein FliL [Bacteroidota bacterium]
MAENEMEDGEEKKSSKKIIIIAALVLLLAGGGAGYFFMAGDPTAPEEGEQIEEVVEEEEEGANEEVYYELEKALIVNFPKGSGASLIQVSVSLLVKGQDTVEALKKHEPMIRNNLLMAISGQGAENLKTREGKEQLRTTMLDEITNVMEKMTGKNKVINLFFTTFVMQ